MKTVLSIFLCSFFAINISSAQILCPTVSESNGVWTYTFGTPETITPTSMRRFQPCDKELAAMPRSKQSPCKPVAELTNRGVLIHLPLSDTTQIYGLGMQMNAFQLRRSKKTIRVNADCTNSLGDSHAPVPFYVTTDGYGVFIDNARYINYNFGNVKFKDSNRSDEVTIEVPNVDGVSVMIFEGPTMKEAVARYNLYSGGGAIPPRWGLGFWYQVHSYIDQNEVLGLAQSLQDDDVPCDVIGIGPGLHTRSYSCSFVWSDKYPDPAGLIRDLDSMGMKINIWEHAYVHPDSPIHDELYQYSGDYRVWKGLVPDFTIPEARKVFADFNRKTFVEIGASGFKLDECDNSDYTKDWCFPECTRFPSGADGEQMHMMFGLRYQDAIDEAFDPEGPRTYGQVRNSGAFAAPYPYVLYSDLYDHRTFINTIASSSFSGLLWSPEVRHATSADDLIRRLQAVILSPLAQVNAWYLKNEPWFQMDTSLNNKGVRSEDSEYLTSICRSFINLRMQLVPYIHAAFVKYSKTGIPPFRALVMDYPKDKNVFNLNGQFMIGDNMMAAPMTADQKKIKVYFPAGCRWYDYFTSEIYEGGKTVTLEVPIDRIPLFVKEGTLLPLAAVTLNTRDLESRTIEFRTFGDNVGPCTLFSDDGTGKEKFIPQVFSIDPKSGSILINGKKKPGKNDFYSVKSGN